MLLKWLKKILWTISIVSIVSCGSDYIITKNGIKGLPVDVRTYGDTVIAAELKPYYIEFINRVIERDKLYLIVKALTEFRIMNFTILDGNKIGLCTINETKNANGWKSHRYVAIDTTIENQYIEQTSFHELAHCLLDADHSDDPDNLLYPTVSIPYDDYISDRDYYIEKMLDFAIGNR